MSPHSGVEARGEGEGGAGREGGGEAAARATRSNLGLKGLELKSEPTDERDKLLTTLAPVKSAMAAGMRLWREGTGCGVPWHRCGGAQGPEGGSGGDGAGGAGAREGCGSPT